VSGLPGSGGGKPAPHLATAETTLLQHEGDLREVLALLRAAKELPDVILDRRRAEDLYPIIVEIRDTVNGILGDLSNTEWAEDGRHKFYRAFDRIVDVWTTYRYALVALRRAEKRADWSQQEGPTPVQVMASLESPRRHYISALEEYYAQLRGVIAAVDEVVASQ
jgi:hypothetical protein